jgi:hypothetical protein
MEFHRIFGAIFLFTNKLTSRHTGETETRHGLQLLVIGTAEKTHTSTWTLPALKNTCHDARFAPHIGANVNAGYIPPAAPFPPHRSRPTGYPPYRQPSTVGVEELVRRGTTSRLLETTTGSAPELIPPKSACAGDAVLRTSTRGTAPWRVCLQRFASEHML